MRDAGRACRPRGGRRQRPASKLPGRPTTSSLPSSYVPVPSSLLPVPSPSPNSHLPRSLSVSLLPSQIPSSRLLPAQVLFSPDRAVAWCLTTPVSTLAGVFRAVALDASGPLDLLPLDQRLLSAPSFPGCIPVTTSMSALYRAHALSRLHLLHPSILIALVPGASLPRDNEESEELWPFSHCGPGTPGDQQLRPILNDGQQRALEGLSAPVEAVQGPPGTGKSSFISEAFLRRIPKVAMGLKDHHPPPPLPPTSVLPPPSSPPPISPTWARGWWPCPALRLLGPERPLRPGFPLWAVRHPPSSPSLFPVHGLCSSPVAPSLHL